MSEETMTEERCTYTYKGVQCTKRRPHTSYHVGIDSDGLVLWWGKLRVPPEPQAPDQTYAETAEDPSSAPSPTVEGSMLKPGAVANVDVPAVDTKLSPMDIGNPAESTTVQVTRERIMEAKAKGYEGDPCGECQNFTLIRNGSCTKCDYCGWTGGCS